MRALKTEKHGIELGVRVGIATGSVVVGDLIGEGASQESAVVGETPNLAAKLQGLAETNTVVVGSVTHALTNKKFSYKDAGARLIKGISEPLASWRVIEPINVESRFDANRKSGLTPLVGREQEIGLLLERWQQAKEGDEQVVLLSGEAGIGKSRIAETILQQAAEDEAVELLYQRSPYYSNTALHPVIERLERMAKFELDDSNEIKLEKLEALLGQEITDASDLAPLYAALLSVHVQGHYQPLEMTAERQKQRTLEALVGHIKDLSRRSPVICLFEDIHWADPTMLEMLGHMIESMHSVPILVVLTFRPEFSPPWRGFTHVTSLTLNRFTRRLASALVERVSDGAQLPDEVRLQIIEKTDGVPIFIEELTKTILESTLTDGDALTITIPTTLHDSLMARLDRLGAVKEVAQTAAMLGREFDRNLLALVSPLGSNELDAALNQLFDAELIYRRGQLEEGRFIFKHALLQDAAYGSLLKAKRQTLHGNIARALDDNFPERTEAEPEMLAHHYTKAGMTKEAIPLWSDAGTRAASRHAVLETINHFRKALQLLSETHPDHLRDKREMKLQIALGTEIQSLGAGISEVAAAYNRTHELSQRIANTPDLFSILHGLWHFSVFRAEFEQSGELVTQMRKLDSIGNSQAGEFESALSAANESLAHVRRTGECWWEAEGHRLRGLALRGMGEESSVFEDCFTQALEVTRSQLSRSLGLRAAVDLAQVWIDQGKRDDARNLLAPIYDWFTEGFDTADLKEAGKLLTELT
ncbi:MAG: hypothetical protein ACI8P9_000313 [Parasphingorhabdus sp.]